MAKKSKEEVAEGLLWQLIDDLEKGRSDLPDETTLSQIAAYAKLYFGDNSEQYLGAKQFDSKPKVIWAEYKETYNKERKARAVRLIEGYIIFNLSNILVFTNYQNETSCSI